VGVHADETVMAYKQRPILSMEERVASVEGCRYVDEVLPNAPLTIDRAWIERHNIDLVIHGDDFSSELEELCYKTPIEMGIYRTVGYTSGISTTELITRIKAAEPD
jgi:glycerol-3-phosphate cytidylyltransferase-like family protein